MESELRTRRGRGDDVCEISEVSPRALGCRAGLREAAGSTPFESCEAGPRIPGFDEPSAPHRRRVGNERDRSSPRLPVRFTPGTVDEYNAPRSASYTESRLSTAPCSASSSAETRETRRRRTLLRRKDGSSEVIRGHQSSSLEVIRGHQRSSEAIRGHQRLPDAIRGHQRLPDVI